MFISQLSLSLSLSLLKNLKEYFGYKYALNHKMVRAVRTERQTSNCDVKCRITFSFQWMFQVYVPPFCWKISTMGFFYSNARWYGVFSSFEVLYSFYAITVRTNEPQSIMGDSRQFLLDDYTVHPNFAHACCARYLQERGRINYTILTSAIFSMNMHL